MYAEFCHSRIFLFLKRVFLGDDAEEDIGTPANTTGTDIPEMTPEGLNREIQGCKESGSRLIPMTPLSGKHLTKDKEGSAVITPVSSSTNLGECESNFTKFLLQK